MIPLVSLAIDSPCGSQASSLSRVRTYYDSLETRLPGIQQRLLVVDTPQFDISATNLRKRVAEEDQ